MIPDLDYAFYVWTSYGLFALIMAWQFLQPRLRRRQILAELREERALRTGGYDDADS
jgi:heme exporter protein CcmD